MRCSGHCKKAAREVIFSKMPDWPFSPRGVFIPQSSATHFTKEADLCVLSWSAINTHFAFGSVATVAWIWATKSSSVRVSPKVGQTILPVATSLWLSRSAFHAVCTRTRAVPVFLWTWRGQDESVPVPEYRFFRPHWSHARRIRIAPGLDDRVCTPLSPVAETSLHYRLCDWAHT